MVGKREGTTRFGKHGCTWDVNIKMCLKKTAIWGPGVDLYGSGKKPMTGGCEPWRSWEAEQLLASEKLLREVSHSLVNNVSSVSRLLRHGNLYHRFLVSILRQAMFRVSYNLRCWRTVTSFFFFFCHFVSGHCIVASQFVLQMNVRYVALLSRVIYIAGHNGAALRQ